MIWQNFFSFSWLADLTWLAWHHSQQQQQQQHIAVSPPHDDEDDQLKIRRRENDKLRQSFFSTEKKSFHNFPCTGRSIIEPAAVWNSVQPYGDHHNSIQ